VVYNSLMQNLRDILKTFDPLEDRYISREYQSYGVHLARTLGDEKHKSMYIKFAKQLHRPVLDEALRFVVDARARNRAALFMWKLKELGAFQKSKEQKAKI
jgi:hypothetical protein